MSDVRVLSVKQPWATLIVRGVKRFEARTWPPRWRGRIAIHASSTPIRRSAWLELVADAEVQETLARAGLSSYADVQALPKSAIVGAAKVADARIVLAWTPEELRDVDAALSSGFPPDILWRLTEPAEFTPITGVDGKLNLWTLTGAAATEVRRRDGSGAAWSGAPHDDAEVAQAGEQERALLEYSRDWLHATITVPPDVRAVLGTRATVRAAEAFGPLVAEVLQGAPLDWSTRWDAQVPVSGPIGQWIFPGRRRVVLHEVCSALAARLTPGKEVPAYLMQTLSAISHDDA